MQPIDRALEIVEAKRQRNSSGITTFTRLELLELKAMLTATKAGVPIRDCGLCGDRGLVFAISGDDWACATCINELTG